MRLVDFELRLDNGLTAVWDGSTAEHAAQRYEDAYPGSRVVKARLLHRHGVFIGIPPGGIKEP